MNTNTDEPTPAIHTLQSPTDPIPVRIARVGAALNSTLRAALGYAPADVVTGPGIQQISAMNRVFCQRLATALRPVDPLATVWHIPGPEPLRRMLRKMDHGTTPKDRLRAALNATDEFQDLIRTVAGDRSGLDAIISSILPESRTKVENEAKQLVYRGMRQIKGMAADLVFDCAIMAPSTRTRRLDFVLIKGYYGLRCIRPGAQLKLGQNGADAPDAMIARSLAGNPVENWQDEVLLRSFCSDPDLVISAQRVQTNMVYSMQWLETVGNASARDIVLAELRLDGPRRHRESRDEKPRTGLTYEINVPSRRYINDLILHEDAYPDWDMGVRILETGERGSASANDHTRDLDVIDLQESIEPLGQGIQRFRTADIPNHNALITHVFEQLGWNPSNFRGYRMKMDYPIFGSQIQYRFDLPMIR